MLWTAWHARVHKLMKEKTKEYDREGQTDKQIAEKTFQYSASLVPLISFYHPHEFSRKIS